MVGKAQGIVFGHAHKTAFMGQIFADIFQFKTRIIRRDSIRAVIAGSLDKRKERLSVVFFLLFVQNAVGFAEKVQVRNTPHVVAVFVFKIAFFVHMHTAQIMFQNTAYITPTGTAADEIIFFVVAQGIYHDVLVHNQGIAGTGFKRRYVRNTRNCGEYSACRSGCGRIKMRKQNGLIRQTFNKRRGVNIRIGHRNFIPSQRFHKDNHHIVIVLLRFGFCRHGTFKIKRFFIGVSYAQIRGYGIVILLRFGFIKTIRLYKAGRIKNIKYRV